MAAESFLLDTNIIAYCFDSQAPAKRRIAIQLTERAFQGQGGISYQVVQEFLNLASLPKPKFRVDDLETYLTEVLFPLCRVMPSLELYSTALRVRRATDYGLYDSLMIASAIRARSAVLYSEDLQDGQRVETVKIVNPFTTVAG